MNRESILKEKGFVAGMLIGLKLLDKRASGPHKYHEDRIAAQDRASDYSDKYNKRVRAMNALIDEYNKSECHEE